MSPVLRIQNLETILYTDTTVVHAVDGLTLEIGKGETFALLGESGCGKSMTALSIMRLLPESGEIVGGSVRLGEKDLLLLPEAAMRGVRGKRISMIFQEPMLSLNPVMTVAEQIGEVLRRHFDLRGMAEQERIVEILNQVGIPDAPRRMHEYPFQFSGGMKQRMMIAMALAGQPELLIADEPTTALDVTIQAQVLDLMRTLQQRDGMAILLITHDLGVAAEMAHRVGIMYAGEIVETAARDAFFQAPAHPYSRKLLASLPGRNRRRQGLRLAAISGNVPPLSQEFVGCRFADRCEHAWDLCHEAAPGWSIVAGEHHVRCHLYGADAGSLAAEQASGRQLRENTNTVDNPGAVDEFTAQIGSHPPAGATTTDAYLLSVTDLKVHFPIRKGLMKNVVGYVKAVDGVSLHIGRGKTLALVGESGCGKTTVGKSILQLIPPTSGSVRYNGLELVGLERNRLRRMRAEFQLIFQDPYSSLNPRMRIVDIIEEGINSLNVGNGSDGRAAELQAGVFPRKIPQRKIPQGQSMDALLDSVGLPPEAKWRYPHEFSGGQRQRIAIARALAVNPKLIICDEPTSALDVSVQAQILNLLKELQSNLGLAYLFITHNISVVEYLADEVAVMYLGRIVERGTVDEVLTSPKHPYTQALLSAVPVIELESKRHIIHLHGDLPSPAHPPAGCHFHPRCPHAMPVCREIYPATSTFSSTHTARCYLYPQEQDSQQA
ncbi:MULTISPECIES: ABC transporter ATP-binding protein [unclassified Nitrosospira]|uniref:ABC transporter ATP-binding protein n=1 Tax=unclassified Nitrosospira TaxID=2609267 RepID=UPI000D3073BA|nr:MULTISPECIES: ABC transporter ATP-binding protein [unclassified Nitrosospira]PTR13915.1 peptide/nickel transport system ATP-binding protein [Nitrosospira sp. Nsp2]WON72855.1 ABC transporter ATP-binding protein [Nitrosospira sp. Is2]